MDKNKETQEFQADLGELRDAVADSARITGFSETRIRMRRARTAFLPKAFIAAFVFKSGIRARKGRYL